eukprot:6214635-Pleurochrysis_carterae.AAC.4
MHSMWRSSGSHAHVRKVVSRLSLRVACMCPRFARPHPVRSQLAVLLAGARALLTSLQAQAATQAKPQARCHADTTCPIYVLAYGRASCHLNTWCMRSCSRASRCKLLDLLPDASQRVQDNYKMIGGGKLEH